MLADEHSAYLIGDESKDISPDRHVADRCPCPLSVVHLSLDRTDRSEAGCAKQVEYHECKGAGCRVIRSNPGPDLVAVLFEFFLGVIIVVQNAECSDDFFLRHETGDRSHSGLPGTESERLEHEGNAVADLRKQGSIHRIYIFFRHIHLLREIADDLLINDRFVLKHLIDHAELSVHSSKRAQEPDDDRRDHDDGTGSLDERPAALPCCTKHVDSGRYMICRKLHDEGSGLACESFEFLQNDTGQDNGADTDKVCGSCHPR